MTVATLHLFECIHQACRKMKNMRGKKKKGKRKKKEKRKTKGGVEKKRKAASASLESKIPFSDLLEGFRGYFHPSTESSKIFVMIDGGWIVFSIDDEG